MEKPKRVRKKVEKTEEEQKDIKEGKKTKTARKKTEKKVEEHEDQKVTQTTQ